MSRGRRRPTASAAASRWLGTTSPEALFVLSAIAQYTGASIAHTLFADVAPQTVAWLRVASGAGALLLVSRRPFRGWTKQQLLGAAVFGVCTALMNTFFYLAIARIDLGKSVTIEFIGPIAVAAAMTRTGRNAAALGLAATGVVVLGGVEIGDNAVGLLWILATSAMWAAYIVFGSRVARIGRGVSGLGLGLAIGAVFLIPIGAPGSGSAITTPHIVLLCALVGVLSNAIGYGIDQFVLRRIPIRRFSVLLALLPVTAVFFGWLVLDQRPSGLDLVGIAAVLAGVAIQERDELNTAEIFPEPG